MRRHIWQVFTYELRRNISRRGFLFTTFGIPLLAFVLFFGYRFVTSLGGDDDGQDMATSLMESQQFRPAYRIGYVDLSGEFSDQRGSTLTRFEDEAAARAALDSGSLDVYYLIAPDYLETAGVTLVMPRFALMQANDNAIRQLVYQRFAREIDPGLLQRLLQPATTIREINLQRDATGQTESSFDADFTVVYVFAPTLLMGQFLPNGYLMQSVIEEKETRLIEILIANMQPTALLVGKILALGLLGLLQILTWMGAIFLFAQVVSMGEAVAALAGFANLSLTLDKVILLLLYFLLGYLLFAAAYGMVGALSNSLQEGPGYAVIFTLPAVVPLYFMSIFIRQPDSFLSIFMSIFPITAPLTMVIRLTVTTVPLWQILLSLALLALAVVGMMFLAGRLFRVNTLLAGHTPKLRDLPRLFRG